MSKFNNERNTKGKYNTGAIAISVDSLFPKLSIEYLNLDNNVLQKKEQLNVFKTLRIVLKHTWREIHQLGKDGIGFETLKLDELKCQHPQSELFSKIDKVTVFHRQGDIPLIGFRVQEAFYLFQIDRNYKAYKH